MDKWDQKNILQKAKQNKTKFHKKIHKNNIKKNPQKCKNI